MAIYESCAYARPAMAKIGSRIEESGMLVRDRGRLAFRREQGGRWNLEGWPKSELTLGQLGRLTGYVIDETTVVQGGDKAGHWSVGDALMRAE